MWCCELGLAATEYWSKIDNINQRNTTLCTGPQPFGYLRVSLSTIQSGRPGDSWASHLVTARCESGNCVCLTFSVTSGMLRTNV